MKAPSSWRVRFQGHSPRRPAAFVAARKHMRAHGGEQLLDRAEGFAIRHALAASHRRAAASAASRAGDMALPPRLVIAGEIGEPRGEPAPAPARAALRADHPAAQLDRLLARSARRRRSNRRRRRYVMAFVEHDSGRALPPSRPRAALTITSAWLAMTRSAWALPRTARSMKHLR
jgi:hypothetical protein